MFRFSTFFLCLAALFLGGPDLPASSEGEVAPGTAWSLPPASTFTFADALPLAVTPVDFPVGIRVLNDTTEDHTLEVHLDGAVWARDAGGEASPQPAVFTLRSTTVELPAAGSGIVTIDLAAPNESLQPGDYRVFVVIYSRSTGNLERKEVKLSLATQKPLPLVPTWDLHYWRWIPFTTLIGTWPREDAHLPLLQAGDQGAAPKTLGYLISENRDEATVQWQLSNEKLESGLQGAEITLVGVDPSTSEYTGTINFQPGQEKVGKVKLRVLIKDHWIWAVLCLILGTMVTLAIQRYLQVGRGILRLRERLAHLGIAGEKAQGRFQKKAGSGSFAGFRLTLDSQRAQVLSALNRLETLGLQKLEDQDDFKAAQETLAQLEAVVASWPRFFDQLQALSTAQTELKGLLKDPERPRRDDDSQENPKCLLSAQKLLAPCKLSVEAYEVRKQDVATATKILVAWPAVATNVQDLLATVRELEQKTSTGDPDRKNLESIKKEIAVAWDRLWRLVTVEDLERQIEVLEFSRDELSKLNVQLTPSLIAPELDSPAALAGAPSPRLRKSLDAEEEPRDYALERRRNDALAFGCALVVAVYGGLAQLYHGHEFVTAWHYFGALVWGAGAKLAVDTVVAGIGRLPSILKTVPR